MSQENVEVLRAGFDAFNRGDYDSWVGAFAEDVEVHDLADTPDTGVFHGHAGVRAWLAKLRWHLARDSGSSRRRSRSLAA